MPEIPHHPHRRRCHRAGAGHRPGLLRPRREVAGMSGFNEIKARAELAGWSVVEAAGGFIVSRWGMSRALPDLAAVAAFLRRVGVRDV